MAKPSGSILLAEIEALWRLTTGGTWENEYGFITNGHPVSRAGEFIRSEDGEFSAYIHNVMPCLMAYVHDLIGYASLLERGMPVHEARETVWPSEEQVHG